ncbi:MAG: PPOX class F420-dependent oxidoreductase [Chloroflexi bacterium]|nr:PPOX class F420-dependent oxidoreductase [Chloroflexota bacterium]
MTIFIPDSHKDLFEKPVYAALTTIMPDGQPQSTVVWTDYDGQYVRVNVARGRQKLKNMERNPKVSVLLIDPQDAFRWIEVRGTVEEITEQGGAEHIEALSRKYLGRGYYGDFTPAERRQQETRLVVKIRPTRVVVFPARR